MRNQTLEKARKKALKIMAELEGEGMFTLMELRILLEREIGNRTKSDRRALQEAGK
jgi:hypothetical protein